MFKIRLHENEYISNHIRENGWWEIHTTEVLLENFQRTHSNTVFVDVGANIGDSIAAFYKDDQVNPT